MKKPFAIMLAAVFTIANAVAAAKPNIVLIFADDLGWKDVGHQGSDFYETPNIDSLAKQGMVFSSGYAAAANCQPSRACLISGNYTPRHGVYAVHSTDRGPSELQRLVPVPNTSGLPIRNITIADALKSAGYATGIFGKWHLGGPDGAAPRQQGFDVVVDTYKGAEAGGELDDATNAQQQRARKGSDRTKQATDDPKGIYSLTEAAIGFIETNRSRPFFAFVSHHAIHTRLEARPATIKHFQEKTKGAQHDDPLYAACLFDFDDGVGRLLKAIKDLGLENNTLVILTSDNGGTRQSSQEPLRGNKGCYYEGGIRVPFIARWPGKIKAGTVCDVPVINVDLYPTFLAAAGERVPGGKVLDGESLLPLFAGKGSLTRDSIFWHFPGYLDSPVIRGRDPVFRTRPVTVIRQGGWKLHLYHEEWQLDGGQAALASNNSVELYNLQSDIGERQNLALKEQKKRDQMLQVLLAWMKSTGAKVPSQRNPAYTGTAAAQRKRR